MKLLSVCAFLIAINYAATNPALSESNDNTFQILSKNQIEDAFLKKLNIKCSQRDNSSCVMLKLVSYMNRMLKKSTISLNENVELTKVTIKDEIKEDPSIYARAQGSDEATLSVMLADKLWTFFKSRSLKWKAFDLAEVIVSSNENGNLNVGMSFDSGRLIDEGRRKMKGSGQIMGMMAAKAIIVGVLIFKGLVLLVGKALLVSKLAFLLASVLALKKLLSKKHITYEVVAHPVHDHHDHHSTVSGWGRSLDGFLENFIQNLDDKTLRADDIAYSAYSQ